MVKEKVKVRYIGDYYKVCLYKGKVYEVLSVENGWYKLMDEARYALLDEYAKQVLRAAKDEPFGTEVAITAALKDMGYLSTVTGNPGAQSVKVPTESVDYVVLHNHPSNEMFSLGDMTGFAQDDKMRAMVVIGNNGQGYLVEKLAEYDQRAFDRLLQIGKRTYQQDPLETMKNLFEEAEKDGVYFIR